MTDQRAAILVELGRADEVAVAERLKTAVNAMADRLFDLPGDDGPLTPERVQELLQATDPVVENVLTVAFPIAEFGRAASIEVLPRALRECVAASAAARQDQTSRPIAAVPAVGRLVWALAAFALHCDRPEVVVEMARARIKLPFSNEVQPVIALTDLRYPSALGGAADQAYRDYQSWLQSRPIVSGYRWFQRDFDSAFAEADLLLAMYSGHLGQGVHSLGRGRDSVRRLRARLGDDAQRDALERLFIGDESLEGRLELHTAQSSQIARVRSATRRRGSSPTTNQTRNRRSVALWPRRQPHSSEHYGESGRPA
jgi:hypothetical protein